MIKPTQTWTEHWVEQFIGQLLRIGVFLAAIVVSIGGGLYLIQYGTDTPSYHIFRSEPPNLRTLSGVTTEALAMQQRGLIQFGLLMLIATPIIRVAFCAVAFAKQGDYPYLILTLTVLAILLLSLFHPAT